MHTSARWTEWILTLSLIIILISLLIIAKAQTSLLDLTEPKSIQTVQVVVDGAVRKPGFYSIESGTPLSELIAMVKPSQYADLRSLPWEQKIEKNMAITVQELSEITVEVIGAVEESRRYALPRGTRICDLKKWIRPTADADLKFFKSQKRLKDGDCVAVPMSG